MAWFVPCLSFKCSIANLFPLSIEKQYPKDHIFANDRFMMNYVEASFSRRLTLYLQIMNPTAMQLANLRVQCKVRGLYFHFAKPEICRQHLLTKKPHLGPLAAIMVGKAGLISTDAEPAAVADLLALLKDDPNFWLIAAQFEDVLFSPEGIIELATKSLSKQAYQAQLLSLLSSPATSLVGTINQPGLRLVTLIDAHSKTLKQ